MLLKKIFFLNYCLKMKNTSCDNGLCPKTRFSMKAMPNIISTLIKLEKSTDKLNTKLKIYATTLAKALFAYRDLKSKYHTFILKKDSAALNNNKI